MKIGETLRGEYKKAHVNNNMLGKTFLTALYCCCRCILFPGTKINISSKVKSQSNTIISEKIKDELMPRSVALRNKFK